MTNFTDLFTEALRDFCTQTEIGIDIAGMIGVPTMLRMIYTATSNARAFSDDDTLASELIFKPACLAASVKITTELAKSHLDLALASADKIADALIMVIGDLFID